MRTHRLPLRWIVVSATLIAVGCTTAALAALLVVQGDRQDARRTFEASSAQVAATLDLALQRETDLAIGSAAYLAANPTASSADLHRWTDSVQLFARYAEVDSIGNVPVVDAADLPRYAATIRHRTGSFTLTPAATGPVYCFTGAAVGRPGSGVVPLRADTNLCPGPRAQNVLAVRDSGVEQYTPYGADYVGIGTPYYRGGRVPATLAERRREFLGFTGTQIRPAAVLAAALAGHPGMHVTLAFQSGTWHGSFSLTPRSRPQLVLPLRGGWSAELSGKPAVPGLLHAGKALALLVAGCVASLLLGLFVHTLGTGRARALRLVAERTKEIEHHSLHDALTGTPNRVLLMSTIERALSRARRDGTEVGVMFLDLDGFKTVNDTYGHATGDRFLQAVTARLAGVVRDSDTLGRLGGDEFVLVLEGESLAHGPELVADRVLATLSLPLHLEGVDEALVPSASIGIATGVRDSAEALVRDADAAMYQAKAAGKHRYARFIPSAAARPLPFPRTSDARPAAALS